MDFRNERDPGKIGNPALRKAIADLVEDPSPEKRAALYHCLTNGPLLIAVREIPDSLSEGFQILSEGITIDFLTSEGDEGDSPVILTFTDQDALNARVPGSPFLALDPETVLNWVLEEGYSGIIINPDGPWAGIPRDDIEDLLGISEKGPHGGRIFTCTDPIGAIQHALTKLINRVNPDAFIYVTDEKTKKYFQFTGSAADPIILDVPIENLASSEFHLAELLFRKMGGAVPPASFVKHPTGKKVSFRLDLEHDVSKATQVSLDMIRRVFRRPPDSTLIIEER